MENNRLTK